MKLFRSIPACYFIACVTWLAAGCTQRETDIGRDALQNVPEDNFLVFEGRADTAHFLAWNPTVSNGRGKSLQVGDAGGFFAFFAMRFNAVAALPESARVDCMVVHLNRNRIWPESSAPDCQVRIREIREYWTEDSLLAGYLPGRETYPVQDSLLLPSSQTSFNIVISESLRTRWVNGDTTTFGLLFEPRSSGTLLDFYSSESFDTSGSQGPTLEMYGVQWRLVDSVWTDTILVVTQTAQHDAYLATGSVAVDSRRLDLNQGFAQRAALYFPLDSITAANFARVVNHAELYFYSDSTHPAKLQYTGVGLLYKDGTMADKDWLTEPDSARAGLVAIASSAFNSTNEFIEFDVSSAVAHWVAFPDSNTGFQILTSEENGHLTRQIFHSPLSEDSTKRPKLKIWLTEQQ